MKGGAIIRCIGFTGNVILCTDRGVPRLSRANFCRDKRCPVAISGLFAMPNAPFNFKLVTVYGSPRVCVSGVSRLLLRGTSCRSGPECFISTRTKVGRGRFLSVSGTLMRIRKDLSSDGCIPVSIPDVSNCTVGVLSCGVARLGRAITGGSTGGKAASSKIASNTTVSILRRTNGGRDESFVATSCHTCGSVVCGVVRLVHRFCARRHSFHIAKRGKRVKCVTCAGRGLGEPVSNCAKRMRSLTKCRIFGGTVFSVSIGPRGEDTCSGLSRGSLTVRLCRVKFFGPRLTRRDDTYIRVVSFSKGRGIGGLVTRKGTVGRRVVTVRRRVTRLATVLKVNNNGVAIPRPIPFARKDVRTNTRRRMKLSKTSGVDCKRGLTEGTAIRM